MKTCSVAVCAAILLGCMPATAGADAITITDGGLAVSPFGQLMDGFETRLVSDNLTARVFGLTGKPLNDPCVTSPCVAGDVRNFSSSVDAFVSPTLSLGTTLNGRFDPVYVSMHLMLTTGDVAIAGATPFFHGVLLPPQPFTMSGRVTLLEGGTGVPGATIFDTLVTGQGTFRVYLEGPQGDAQPPFSFNVAGFEFDPATSAPTPEPATLLMVASGLAFVGRAARRGRAGQR
jgi:hypothetical protein